MPLCRVAVYRRRIAASIERVLENVHDWEHLPWLHDAAFASIALAEQGDWGWRARIGLHGGGEILLELRFDGAHRYVSRTCEGPGAGTEIWTDLAPRGADRTDVEVEFLVPDVPAEATEKVGARFVSLYTRLWDEDEAMMIRREGELAARRASRDASDAKGDPIELGPRASFRERLPLLVEQGGRTWRIVELGGELVVHATTCPHLLGPLDEAAVEAGRITCPWHGYRFDVRTGRGCEAAHRLRLEAPPALRIDPRSGAVTLGGDAPAGS